MKKILFLLLAGCLFVSCPQPSHDIDTSERPERTFSKVDIVDAHTLYVAVVGEGDESVGTLYSVKDGGEAKEVSFSDANGVAVTSPEVAYVLNVNDEYVLMEFRVALKSSWDSKMHRFLILIRKSDGVVLSMDSAGHPRVSGEEIPYIQSNNKFLCLFTHPVSDWNDDGYYADYNDSNNDDIILKRIDLATLEVKAMTLDNDSYYYGDTFYIDADGNVAYTFQIKRDEYSWRYSDTFRFIRASGGYASIVGEPVFSHSGKIFAWGTVVETALNTSNPTSRNRLSAISIDGEGKAVHDEYTWSSNSSYDHGLDGDFLTSGVNTFFIRKSTDDVRLYKINDSPKAIVKVSAELNDRFTRDSIKVAISNNFLYVSGANATSHDYEVARMNLSSGAIDYKDLSTHEVLSITATDTSVVFTGNEFLTGSFVVGEMNWDTGVVTKLHTSSPGELVRLEQVR